MKKILLFAALCVLAAGCASSSKNEASLQVDKYQIVDQEFEGLAVPNDNYDRVAPYEEQVSGASYIQSINRDTDKKAARKMAGKKVVVDEKGNVLSSKSSAPVTDQEALPDEAN